MHLDLGTWIAIVGAVIAALGTIATILGVLHNRQKEIGGPRQRRLRDQLRPLLNELCVESRKLERDIASTLKANPPNEIPNVSPEGYTTVDIRDDDTLLNNLHIKGGFASILDEQEDDYELVIVNPCELDETSVVADRQPLINIDRDKAAAIKLPDSFDKIMNRLAQLTDEGVVSPSRDHLTYLAQRLDDIRARWQDLQDACGNYKNREIDQRLQELQVTVADVEDLSDLYENILARIDDDGSYRTYFKYK